MKNIIEYSKCYKNAFRNEVLDCLEALEEYEIDVRLSADFIESFINRFYELYEKKKIVYKYLDEMTLVFHRVCLAAIAEKDTLVEDDLLKNVKFFILMESPVEISPKDTNKTIKKIKRES